MKKSLAYLLLAILCFAVPANAKNSGVPIRKPGQPNTEKISPNYRSKAKKCHGKIRVVTHGGDFSVFVVNDSSYDIAIEVDSTYSKSRDKPGYWHFVSSGEHYTVRFVENRSAADFVVKLNR